MSGRADVVMGQPAPLLVDKATCQDDAAADSQMIRLVHANRLEDLADALAGHLGKAGLDPVEIVVPHSTWASWLKMAIAHRTGIAANLRFDTLHGFLRRAVDPDPR